MTQLRVAFGPRVPGAGSWEWLGEDLAAALEGPFETVVFDREVPPSDVVVFIKYKPPADVLREIGKRSAVIYCPVDVYGSAAEIDADEGLLACDRIVVHCPKLAKYTRSYAPTVCLDHHLKFITPLREQYVAEGPILWVGVRSNLPSFAQWLQQHRPQDDIWVLTNPERPDDLASPEKLGLRSGLSLRLGEWTPERHLEWSLQARAAIDIKGDDFRSRHKPAAKALDFLASGVPLAMNPESSPAEYLHKLGFDVARSEDRDHWLSREYWEETIAFGRQLRERYSPSHIAQAWTKLINEVAARRQIPIPRTKVAIVSLLFNWPSTGGGTVHTFETARFLERAGYEVKHFYIQSDTWEVGKADDPLDYPAEPIPWEPSADGLADLQQRIRKAVDAFAPDFVIVTDSWTMKSRLAEAVRGYKFFLRLAAQECLCPLNNLRMLVDESGHVTRCPRHQLATPESCRECVTDRPKLSGILHQRERDLAGYGTDDYEQSLKWAFAEAEAVLVVNPLIETMVSPYTRRVRVVPSGFDPARFPWPWPVEKNPRTVILFAGLIQELMKGFAVVHAACRRLWNERQDFELWITDDPIGQRDDFTRAIGWQSQTDLPKTLRQSDIVVFPTVAEEALGRTAVEAMAVGRPVIASRIGGLPWTVPDGSAGLLFEPGNSVDLAEKLSLLLDDSELREQLGTNGRRRFETEYTWDVIITRHYRPLLGRIHEHSRGRGF